MGGMGLLLGLLKKTGSVFIIAIVVIGLALWLIPMPFLGGRQSTVKLFMMAFIVIMMLIIFVMQKVMMATRGSKKLEASMTGPGGGAAAVRPDKKKEIEQLKAKMNEAIASLKTSKLAKGRKGATALYVLPWYVIIGPPGSGKSTALAKSELNFPYLDPSGKGLRGVGGTRNCDWWFTSEAIILDTAGRYTTESDDREEWFAFLDLLKKYRSRVPINGIIVAVAISDLMKASDDELTEHARTIRARIDELINKLGISFPVYMLFTKCDLLDGFVETFDDMRKTERAQVWGATFAVGQDDRPARVLFEKEFEKLSQALEDRRTVRLAAETKAEVRQKVYLFPLEFRSAQEALADFVGMVFQSNPYQEQPLFRGFYFSSGTQEGTPLDLVMTKLMDTFRLPAPLQQAVVDRGEMKSYFIHDLFEKVMFPDQYLAGPTLKGSRKQSRLRTWLALGTAGVCLLWLVGAVFSFFGNTMRIQEAKSYIRPRQTGEPSLDELRSLDSLRAFLVKVEGSGWSFVRGWGLNQDDEVLKLGKHVYFRRFAEFFQRRSESELLEQLKTLSARGTDEKTVVQNYDATTSYLILTRPDKADSTMLSLAFRRVAEARIRDADKREYYRLVGDQVAFFRRHKDFVEKVRTDPDAIREAQDYFAANLSSDIYYQIRKSTYGGGLANRDLAAMGIMGGKLKSSSFVEGAYTDSGWVRLKTVMGFEGKEKITDWTFENLYGDRPETWRDMKSDLQAGLAATHVSRVGDAWGSYLKSVSIETENTDCEKAADELTAVTGDPQLKKLMQAANKGTTLTVDSLDRYLVSSLETRYGALRALVGGAEPQWPVYREKVNAVAEGLKALGGGKLPEKQAFDKAVRSNEQFVEQLVVNFDSDVSTVVGALLKEPVRRVKGFKAGCKSSENGGGGGGSGAVVICPVLADKYPFSSGGEESQLSDVADCYKRNGGLFWNFYQSEWAERINENGTPKNIPGVEPPLSHASDCAKVRRAYSITRALGLGSGEKVKVEYDVKWATMSGEAARLVENATFTVSGQKREWKQTQAQTFASEWAGGDASIKLFGPGNKEIWNKSFSGPWAFFRLLESADERITDSQTGRTYKWNLEVDGKKGTLSCAIEAKSERHPFEDDLFRGFKP